MRDARAAVVLLNCVLGACSSHPTVPTSHPESSAHASSVELCGTAQEPRIDMEQAVVDGSAAALEDPCLPAFSECIAACNARRCDVPPGGNLPIGGGCSHRCGRTDVGYLA